MKIKFRAWDKQKKCWYPHEKGEWININQKGEVIHGFDCDIDEGDESRFVIQQFTGLLDKHGTEIYVGDIVKTVDSLYEIQACVGGFDCKERDGVYSLAILFPDECEVLGHVFA